MDRDLHKYLEDTIIRFVEYILRPFQMSKLIEVFYAANWTWVALLSLLPEASVSGSIFTLLRQGLPNWATSVILITFSTLSFYVLAANITIARRLVLIINLAIILLLFSRIVFNVPISSGSGFLAILAGLTILSYWKMDIGTDVT